MANTDFAPYVAISAAAGNDTHSSVSPRRNFASAVWMPVCSCGTILSPVLRASSATNAPTSPIGWPCPSNIGTGHGEKSMTTGLPDFTRSASHWASLSVRAAISRWAP